jgi:hypothetical protein
MVIVTKALRQAGPQQEPISIQLPANALINQANDGDAGNPTNRRTSTAGKHQFTFINRLRPVTVRVE